MINTLFDKNIVSGLIGYILLPLLIIAYDYYVFKNLSRAILMGVSYLAILIGISLYYKYKSTKKIETNIENINNNDKREFGSVVIDKPANSNTDIIVDNNNNTVNIDDIPELKDNDKEVLIEEFANNNDDNDNDNDNIINSDVNNSNDE